jgi:hypothetical protein
MNIAPESKPSNELTPSSTPLTGALIAEVWTKYDDWRQWNHKHKLIMQQPHEREYRYEERYATYVLKCWHEGKETTIRGEVCSRPEWLTRIIDVAVVGGHLKRVYAPPPDAIVWFITDQDRNLLHFLELT